MSKPNPQFYEVINASPETKTVDMMIYGSIPSLDPDSYKMKNSVESFLKEFKALEKDFDRINIRINSPGGSLYHAFPIFNAILNSKRDIHTYNDGLAASAGGLLLLAGKKIHTAKNGLLMIHNAMSFSMGNAEDFRETIKVLDIYDGVIAKTFADRTGMSVEQVKEKYLNYKDHWLDAEEAKEAGFVDEIDEYESEDAPPSNIKDLAFDQVMNLYSQKPEPSLSLFEKLTNHIRDTFKLGTLDADSIPPHTEETTNQTDMDFTNSLTILAKAEVTAEELASVKAEIEAFTGAAEKFTAAEVTAKVDAAKNDIQTQLDAVTNEKTALDTKVSDLEATVASYKASGVTIDNVAGAGADPIPGEDVDNFLSETDIEARKMRAEAGYATN